MNKNAKKIKICKALLAFSIVTTVRGFSRSQKFLFIHSQSMEHTFEYISFPAVLRRGVFVVRLSMHLEMSNSKSFVPCESTNGLGPSKV